MMAKHVVTAALFLTVCSLGHPPQTPPGKKLMAMQQLAAGFLHPPVSTRPGAYWCWLNGDVTRKSITHDLEEMKEKGMGRAEIWDVGAVYNPGGAYGTGPEFLGDSSVAFIRHALAEGKRLGMQVGMVSSSGWNAGGTWVKPDWAEKGLYWSVTTAEGPGLFRGSLPFPALPALCPRDRHGLPIYSREVAVIAVPASSDKKIQHVHDVRILNKFFNGKTLRWKIPPGKWTILRFVCSNTGQRLIVPSPKSGGLFIDFLDPGATIKYLRYILGRLGITRGNAAGSGLSYLSFDSMELDSTVSWTDKMDSIFYVRNGYDVLPCLPAFAGWRLPAGNGQFLANFKKTVSDQLIFSHYMTGKNFLSKFGIDMVAEAGGPGPPIWNSCPVDALKALGNVSVPRGEFWVRNIHNIFLVKEIASASHIYGLKLTDGESFTTWRRWKDAPHDLKPYIDRAFCEGLNRVTMHAFSNTRPEFGLPGRAYHAGSDINPTATWWEYARPFMDYMSRCSYLLRQGISVADVAYYYGDKAPNFFPEIQGSPHRPGLNGLGFGYDFDVVNSDVLLNRMTASAGRLLLPGGLSYRLLVIPDPKNLAHAIRKKIDTLMAEGAHVLFQDSSASGGSIDDALRRLDVEKDFTGNADKLDFIHRRTAIGDIYFVRNRTAQNIDENCRFRSVGRQVELWDPVTGRQCVVKTAAMPHGETTLQLHLPPDGSCFIVISQVRRQLPEYVSQRSPIVMPVKGPWRLSFPDHWGAPGRVTLDTLVSWTEFPDSGVKYFSGTATYHNGIVLGKNWIKEAHAVELNLGDVRDVAEVLVNGRRAGILWTYPFTINIRDYLKPGENSIEIKVADMWVNRLTGDRYLPAGKKYCKTNIPDITVDRSPAGDEKYHLQLSGLLGPVTLSAGP